MRTILVPLDGSTLAERVYPYVRLLATTSDAKVKLLRVIAHGETFPAVVDKREYAEHRRIVQAVEQAYVPIGVEAMREQASTYLKDEVLRLRAAGIDAETEVIVGNPAEVIVQVANELEDPMVVMATHGYSGLRRWMLGSVTDKVAHSLHCPLFVVHAEQQTMDVSFRRILVPLDGSELARQALPMAAQIAIEAGASEVVLLTAIKPILAEYPYGVTVDPPDVNTVTAEMMNSASESVTMLVNHGIKVTALANHGFPAEVIVDSADREQADLLVMATHGYSGLRRWTLGSIADKVLHTTTTPVLLVRAQEA